MKQIISRLGVGVYALLCLVTLAVWLPQFVAANLTLVPPADYRYWAASGAPFGLFLLSAVARQSLAERLELFVVLELFLAGISLYASKLTFYYTPQATFFCPLHVWLCVVFILINLYQYRRRLKALEPKPAAA